MNTMKEYFNTIILPLSKLINKKKNDTQKNQNSVKYSYKFYFC